MGSVNKSGNYDSQCAQEDQSESLRTVGLPAIALAILRPQYRTAAGRTVSGDKSSAGYSIFRSSGQGFEAAMMRAEVQMLMAQEGALREYKCKETESGVLCAFFLLF